jgi:hypothetical protein
MMKKLLVILCLAAIGTFAFAHPPKEIKVDYDAKSSLLTITVVHSIKNSQVSDPAKHFIKQITVEKNGAATLDAAYFYQQYEEGEVLIVKMPAKTGDKVKVAAFCKLAGQKEMEFTVK